MFGGASDNVQRFSPDKRIVCARELDSRRGHWVGLHYAEYDIASKDWAPPVFLLLSSDWIPTVFLLLSGGWVFPVFGDWEQRCASQVLRWRIGFSERSEAFFVTAIDLIAVLVALRPVLGKVIEVQTEATWRSGREESTEAKLKVIPY